MRPGRAPFARSLAAGVGLLLALATLPVHVHIGLAPGGGVAVAAASDLGSGDSGRPCSLCVARSQGRALTPHGVGDALRADAPVLHGFASTHPLGPCHALAAPTPPRGPPLPV
jgi:hypothetical protein